MTDNTPAMKFFVDNAKAFYQEWLKTNTGLSDEDLEEATSNIAHDVQVGLPYYNDDLDDIVKENPKWSEDIDSDDEEYYETIQLHAGNFIWCELMAIRDTI